MKTTFLALVTTLVAIAAPAAQNAQQLFDAAKKQKPARVTSTERIAPTTAKPDGSQEVSSTIRLRSKGDF